MPTLSHSDMVWVPVNAIGAGLFLSMAATCCWIEPELANISGASGGAAFVWAIYALPIAAAFIIADLIRLGLAVLRKHWTSTGVSTALLFGWFVILFIDGTHHGM